MTIIKRFQLITLFISFNILTFNHSQTLHRRQTPAGAGPTATIGSPLSLAQADLAKTKGVIGPLASDGSQIIIMTAQIRNFSVQL